MGSSTSARPNGGPPAVPAKMTSSILPPRSDLAPCSPMTQARASTTLDFPEPFGPTMQVIPGSSWSVVEEAKDLNPLRVRLFRYKVGLLSPAVLTTHGWAREQASYAGLLPGEAATSRLRRTARRRAARDACRLTTSAPRPWARRRARC